MSRPTHGASATDDSIHTFHLRRENPNGAWCTATWVPFIAASEEQAIEAKRAAYGDARFLDDLPVEKRVEVIEIRETWDRPSDS